MNALISYWHAHCVVNVSVTTCSPLYTVCASCDLLIRYTTNPGGSSTIMHTGHSTNSQDICVAVLQLCYIVTFPIHLVVTVITVSKGLHTQSWHCWRVVCNGRLCSTCKLLLQGDVVHWFLKQDRQKDSLITSYSYVVRCTPEHKDNPY